MKWMSRILCMVLALVMLLGVIGCKKKDEGNAETTAPAGDVSTTEDVNIPEDAKLGIADDLYYGNNKEFTMLLRTSQVTTKATEEWYVGEELTTAHSVVDKAVWTRNQNVENRLGIKLKYIWIDTNLGDLLSRFRSSAGMNEFHVAGTNAANCPTLITEGLCENYLNVPNLDLTKVWWGSRSGMAKDLTINNQLYMISGDASLMAQGKALAMYVNMKMLSTYAKMDISALYDEVQDGKWTIDRLMEISKGASVNTGDSVWDENDIYGNNIYLATIIDNYFSAFNIDILVKDGDGMLALGMDTNTMDTATQKLHELCYDDHRTYMTTNKGTSAEFFKNGHAVFTHGGFEWAEQHFQDMKDDYGIIPYPKLTEDQPQYGATLSDVYTAYVLPKGVAEPAFVGAVMEVIGHQSYNVTTPAYHETLLKVRSTRDTESQEMLDLIHDIIDYNPGFVYSTDLGNPGQAFRTLLAKGNKFEGNFSSWWSSNSGTIKKNMKNLIEFYYPEGV